MSIIQEALKKAEARIKDAKPVQPASSSLPGGGTGPDLRRKTVHMKPSATQHDPRAVVLLFVVLVVTAIFAARELFPGKAAPAKPPTEIRAVPSVKPAAPSTQDVSYKPIAGAEAKPQQSADAPSIQSIVLLAPQTQAAKPEYPEFILNGIMYLEDEPRAIINNSMVGPGDTVGGARVMKIDKRSVLLQYNDVEITLSLK